MSYVPEYLYYRQYHANSVMTSKKTMKNLVSAATVYHGLLAFSEENGGIVPDAYLVRMAFNVFTCFEALTPAEKKAAAERMAAVRKDVLAHGAFGDAALKMRCYGKPLWAACRAAQKIIH